MGYGGENDRCRGNSVTTEALVAAMTHVLIVILCDR